MKALELDPLNAGADNVLANVKQGYEWDLDDADKEYRRALELNPSHPAVVCLTSDPRQAF